MASAVMMLFMEGDPRPDRDGYLDFKTAIENGNSELKSRAAAEFDQQREQHPSRLTTTLACYMELEIIEELSRREDRYDANDIYHESEKRLAPVQERTIRQQAINRINRLLNVWDKDRSASWMNHIELYDYNLRRGIEKRQSENAGEKHSESWFHAKRDIDNRYLKFQMGLKAHLDRAIDKTVYYARVKQAKALAEQFDDVRRLRQREQPDHDRER